MDYYRKLFSKGGKYSHIKCNYERAAIYEKLNIRVGILTVCDCKKCWRHIQNILS